MSIAGNVELPMKCVWPVFPDAYEVHHRRLLFGAAILPSIGNRARGTRMRNLDDRLGYCFIRVNPRTIGIGHKYIWSTQYTHPRVNTHGSVKHYVDSLSLIELWFRHLFPPCNRGEDSLQFAPSASLKYAASYLAMMALSPLGQLVLTSMRQGLASSASGGTRVITPSCFSALILS